MEFKPKWVALEITRRCNLNCIHCRSHSEMSTGGHPDLSTKEILRIIDELIDYSNPVIVLSGGEPLLRDDIFEIADYAVRKGVRLSIATNGTLVNDEVCKNIKRTGVKVISLSLDGSTADIHDDFRKQKGAFEGVINATRLFRKHGIEFIINSSFTKRNQHDIPNVYKLAKELGATAWYMFMVVPTGRGEDLLRELISKEDYEDILGWHYRMEREEHDLLVRPACAAHYYRVVLQKSKEEGLRFERRSFKFSTGGAKGCVVGQIISFIDVDGNVLPCSYLPKAAGSLKEHSFKDIWENSELFQELRDPKKHKGKCGSCEYNNICGGCRARAYSINGDYLGEDPFCNYVPLKYRYPAHVS